MKVVIMPILSLALGIIALFNNPKTPEGRKLINSTLAIALVFTCTLEIYFKHQDQVESNSYQEWSRATMSNMSEGLATFRSSTEGSFNEIKKILAPIFYKAGATQQAVDNLTPAQLNRGVEAEKALRSATSNPQANNRSSVVVQYFYKPEDVNPEKVKAALEELGFTVKVAVAKNNLPTNSIWYGNPVNVNDAKLVAYTLIRAGVQIRQIAHFANDVSKMNAQIMQVGADPEKVDSPPYTIEQIRDGQFNR